MTRAGHDEDGDDATLAAIAVYDWVVTPTGNVLHKLDAFDDPLAAENEWGGAGRLTCGLWTEWLRLPGLFERMGLPRCKRCCHRVGFPQGVGSPKNDKEPRPMVGLNV